MCSIICNVYYVLYWSTDLSSSFSTTTTPQGRRGERENDDDDNNNNKNNTSPCVEQLLVHTYWLYRSNTAGHLLLCYLKIYILSTISEHQNHITADKFAKL